MTLGQNGPTRKREPVDARTVIDSCFRYLEMLAVTALVSVVTGIISPTLQQVATSALTIAAGLYVSLPASQYLVSGWKRADPPRPKVDATAIWMIALGAAAALSTITSITIISLITATVDLDESKARERLMEIRERALADGCTRPPSTPASADRCIAEGMKKLHPPPLPILPRPSRATD